MVKGTLVWIERLDLAASWQGLLAIVKVQFPDCIHAVWLSFDSRFVLKSVAFVTLHGSVRYSPDILTTTWLGGLTSEI